MPTLRTTADSQSEMSDHKSDEDSTSTSDEESHTSNDADAVKVKKDPMRLITFNLKPNGYDIMKKGQKKKIGSVTVWGKVLQNTAFAWNTHSYCRIPTTSKRCPDRTDICKWLLMAPSMTAVDHRAAGLFFFCLEAFCEQVVMFANAVAACRFAFKSYNVVFERGGKRVPHCTT